MSIPRTRWWAAAFAVCALASAGEARAQPADTLAEEPTSGVYLPTAPLAGEYDAQAVVTNPAGLGLLRGGHAALAADVADDDAAAGAGEGVGLYLGGAAGGGFLPRLGVGLGVEALRPPEEALAPDPGSPTRLSLALALPLGRQAAVGAAYRRFLDEGGPIDGVDTWDLGLATRFGPRVAAGFVVRDVGSPEVGDTPVQRRYELEVALRPWETDVFELGVGGRIGEIRADVDGWMRWSWRLARGLYFRGELLTRELHRLAGGSDRDYRLSAGFEVSFGGVGGAAYASGAVRSGGDPQLRGGSAILRASQEQVPAVGGPPGRLARIELEGELGEREHTALVARMRRIARDDGVAAVFVQLDGVSAGWATVQEIRTELAALRDAGKPVFAYMVAGGTRDYYIATAADSIYVDPAGGVRLDGLSGTSLYFKGLFEDLGVVAQFEKIAEFKTAPESYTRAGPTDEALEMRDRLFDSLYAQLVGAIASGRGIEPDKARALVDAGPYTAGDLAEIPALVDGIVSSDDLERAVERALGARYPVRADPLVREGRWAHPAVAVIYIAGDIVDGESRRVPIVGRDLVGAETITKAIESARTNDDIEAIVLRIDSPGGSALASELMAREVFKTRGVKPIICSLGDIAASGGYFIAAGCDTIFAEPTTITGSIGIFAGKFDVSGLLDRLGISWRIYKRGEHADMDSVFRPYSPEERALLLDKLEYYYGRFVDTVAEGRDMTPEEVDDVGRGRVWTGVQAEAVDLVDTFGGVGDAIRLAKIRAGIGADEPVRVVELPELPGGLLGKVLGSVGGAGVSEDPRLALPPALRDIAGAIPGSLWAEPEAVQARLPFHVLWE